MKTVYAAVFGIGSFFAMNCGSGNEGGYYSPTTQSSSPTTAQGDVVEVQVLGHEFSPSEVHIKANQKVRWVWVAGRHNVVSGAGCTSDGKFTSGALTSAPSTFEQKFEKSGSFPYYCDPHCTMGMTGTVVVE